MPDREFEKIQEDSQETLMADNEQPMDTESLEPIGGPSGLPTAPYDPQQGNGNSFFDDEVMAAMEIAEGAASPDVETADAIYQAMGNIDEEIAKTVESMHISEPTLASGPIADPSGSARTATPRVTAKFPDFHEPDTSDVEPQSKGKVQKTNDEQDVSSAPVTKLAPVDMPPVEVPAGLAGLDVVRSSSSSSDQYGGAAKAKPQSQPLGPNYPTDWRGKAKTKGRQPPPLAPGEASSSASGSQRPEKAAKRGTVVPSRLVRRAQADKDREIQIMRAKALQYKSTGKPDTKEPSDMEGPPTTKNFHCIVFS